MTGPTGRRQDEFASGLMSSGDSSAGGPHLQERLLAGPAASLKAKLTEKTKYLPTAVMKKRMPAGSDMMR